MLLNRVPVVACGVVQRGPSAAALLCPVRRRSAAQRLRASSSPRGHRLSALSDQKTSVASTKAEMLSRIESLRAEVDDLEAELRQASVTGELCARRSRRLRERQRQLSEYALEHVLQGDEGAARSALQIKASVREALDSATQRALANAALAGKLERVIEEKQIHLLQAIREARAELDRRSGGDAARATAQQRELRRAGSGSRRQRSADGGV